MDKVTSFGFHAFLEQSKMKVHVLSRVYIHTVEKRIVRKHHDRCVSKEYIFRNISEGHSTFLVDRLNTEFVVLFYIRFYINGSRATATLQNSLKVHQLERLAEIHRLPTAQCSNRADVQ